MDYTPLVLLLAIKGCLCWLREWEMLTLLLACEGSTYATQWMGEWVYK